MTHRLVAQSHLVVVVVVVLVVVLIVVVPAAVVVVVPHLESWLVNKAPICVILLHSRCHY